MNKEQSSKLKKKPFSEFKKMDFHSDPKEILLLPDVKLETPNIIPEQAGEFINYSETKNLVIKVGLFDSGVKNWSLEQKPILHSEVFFVYLENLFNSSWLSFLTNEFWCENISFY